jgi:uncharacterized protein (DUF488 family)
MKKTIYTIGYSGCKPEDFIDELYLRNINVVIDVRSQPYSKYRSEYNKEALEELLKSKNINYRNLALEFGARQTNRKYYTYGKLDFEKFAASEIFSQGIEKIKSASNLGYIIALMCAEKEPDKCHRAILIARALRDNGFEISHIVPGQPDCTQEDLEQKLLEKYFSDREQVSLFDENTKSEEELIREAYRNRAFEIAYGGEW